MLPRLASICYSKRTLRFIPSIDCFPHLLTNYEQAAIFFSGQAAYRLHFHPLKSFPGPILNRLTRLVWVYHICIGDWVLQVSAMHEKYGPVVRVAPDELSFIDPIAWKDIYGSQPSGELPKAVEFIRASRKFPPSILLAEGREEHRMLRRRLALGFSEQVMRMQESLIGSYVDLLVKRLRENCNGGVSALNMRDWYSEYHCFVSTNSVTNFYKTTLPSISLEIFPLESHLAVCENRPITFGWRLSTVW